MLNSTEFFLILDDVANTKGVLPLSYSCKRTMYGIYQMALENDYESEVRKVCVSAKEFASKYNMSKRIVYNSLKELVEKELLQVEKYKREFKRIKDGYQTNKGQVYIIDLALFNNAFLILKEECNFK